MTPWHSQWVGLFRPRRILRQIPDAVFNRLFDRLSSDRVAFWASTGARPASCPTGAPVQVRGASWARVVCKRPHAPAAAADFAGRIRMTAALPAAAHDLVPTGPDAPLRWNCAGRFVRSTTTPRERCPSA